MDDDLLRLDNQICFPIYAASRLITREYQPYLEKLGVTYPQYLVLLVLWENDELPVNDIAQKLILNTNTITPLLKRMESQGLITRRRLDEDERKVIIRLTDQGRELRKDAIQIPQKLVEGLVSESMSVTQLQELKKSIDSLLHYLVMKNGIE
jgi:DNA-binding MarR family transcriptional regulator